MQQLRNYAVVVAKSPLHSLTVLSEIAVIDDSQSMRCRFDTNTVLTVHLIF